MDFESKEVGGFEDYRFFLIYIYGVNFLFPFLLSEGYFLKNFESSLFVSFIGIGGGRAILHSILL